MRPVTGMYVEDEKLKVEFDDQAVTGGVITSAPPEGSFRVTNVFVDPLTGRLTVQYDNLI